MRREQFWLRDVTRATARGALSRCRSTSRSSGCCASSSRRWPTHTVAAVTAEVPGYTGALSGADGREHRGGGADGAGGLPQAGRRSPGRRPEHAARPDPGGGLRPGPRRGPQRPLDGRPARRVPGRCAGGLARAVLAWRRRPGSRPRRWRSSPSWCSPTSTSCPPPAPPGTPTSCRRAGESAIATASGWASSCSHGAGHDVLEAAAERADWTPPTTLTAVLVPSAQVRGVLASLGAGHPRRGRGPAGRRGRQRPGTRSRCSWSRMWTGPAGGT